ncbi:hypothetical protein [Myxococcus sp. RHSTA-1-4]|uniref:hypothetical protein n=1 Tax=Myxococcus sp. RHSTA-1-4 TaxID=2874601 RepID=UPI001CBB0AA2|nr:hypothetical protein [Myxococcus sp. RHSTA-1-4]MBZ4418495.1 hypothetical protein [Myxococcus sp. RHSTA-1-4]
MKIRLAMCTVLAFLGLLIPRPAAAGCHFWSFADGTIDSDKDISGGEPNGRPLVRFFLVCHDSLVDHATLNPDLGVGEVHSIPGSVPLMVAAHGGNGNLLSFKKGDDDLSPMESTYLMIYPQGVCDGDSGKSAVSVQRQTQTYNILNNGNWPTNIVTSCTEDLEQTTGAMEQAVDRNAALTSRGMQSKFEWRSVKVIDGDPLDQEYLINCQGGIGSPCGFRLDDYSVPGNGTGVDARYAESDQYAYRDLRAIAGIVARVKAIYYPVNATPLKRFLGFSSGAGLGLTILKYRHDLFDAYAFAGHPVSIRWVQAEEFTPLGTANTYYDAAHFASGLGFNQYPTNIGGPEGTMASGTFDLTDVGNGHDPFNRGTSNGLTLGNLNPAGINKRVLFVQGSADMANLMRISRLDPADPASAGYGPPASGDALPSPQLCGTSLNTSTSSAYVWQRYVNHSAQFLDMTAGAATPAILDRLSCANSGWTSVAAPPVLVPTSILSTCVDFGYPNSCGGDQVLTNYVYEFGGGNIKMIIPDSGGHTMPTVLSSAGGSGGGGNQIRDFSLAQEACIWFGDGCTRTVW